ncbi:hypothetical protein HFP89_10415 [Wenzhouxiangella sp. XN79A]|uniref:hypothetical protein n=1 Tax=Wenzhouxiangella sp. XN79A TaxID=2724193 RepID=UPI00144AEA93|nr:hypothetical protein [Wenzhouxiangella sp. XN79A]NKI35578.1 hypothetical protein [Wenzhouxiangella sp. XN79A]
MSTLLRRNPFIVLGVSLPLLLVILVLVVQTVKRWGGERPTTPVLYVFSADRVVQQHLIVDVADGRLGLALEVPDSEVHRRRRAGASLELAIHDPRDGSLQRHVLDVEAPDDGSGRTPLVLPPALRRLELDRSPISPGGARLVIDRRSGSGLFRDVFGFGRGRARYRLELDGVGFDVPGHPQPYGAWPGFIAWVVGP